MSNQPPKGISVEQLWALQDAGLQGADLYNAATEERPEMIRREREKVDYLANLSRDQRPAWMDDDTASAFSALAGYMASTNSGVPPEFSTIFGDYLNSYQLPTEVAQTIATPDLTGGGGLPQATTETPAIVVPGAVTPNTPIGMGGWQGTAAASPLSDAETYGMTQEAWDSLSTWQQFSMRVFGTNTTAAAATGAAAGLQGGLAGAAVGAASGTLLASAAEKWPVLAKVFDAFNKGARAVKGTQGILTMIGTDEITLSDVMDNLDAAYAAGQQYYRSRPEASGMFGLMEEEAARMGIERAPTTAWQFGTTEEAIVPEDQTGPAAIVEYFNRLKDVPAAEFEAAKAALDAEFEQRYGFEGMQRDMWGEIILDPLNVAGGAAAKVGKGVAAVTGSKTLGAALEGADGPVQGINRFRKLAGQVGDYKELSGLEKFLSKPVLNKDGSLRLMDVPEPATNKVKRAFDYVTSLTPEARAREYVSIASENLAAVAEMGQANPREFVRLLDAVANNDMVAARNIGAEFFGGAEMGAVVPMLKENLGAIRKLLDDFDAPETAAMRGLLQGAADASGRTMDDIIKNLTDPVKRDNTARTLAAALGEGADPEALKAAAETMDGAAYLRSDKLLTAKMYSDLIEGAHQFSVKYFKVEGNSGLVKLSNLVKSLQGIVLLDLSPTYLANNVIDNTVKLAREGVFGIRTTADNAKFFNDFLGEGIVPSRLKDSGLAGDFLLKADDAIADATRAGEWKIQKTVSAARKKTAVASKISSGAENYQRVTAMRVGIEKAWNNLWQPGKGFDKLPPELENLLGPEMSNRIMGRVQGARSGDITLEGILQDTPYSLDDAITEAAQGTGKNAAEVRQLVDSLGLTERLQQAKTREDYAGVYADVQKSLDQWHTSQILAQAEKAANTAGAEGPLGTMRVFDDINQAYYDQRMADFDTWEGIFAQRGNVKPDEFGAMVQRQFTEDQKTYRRINENAKAQYAGVAEKLGTESQYGRSLAGNLADADDAWANFYDYRKQQLKEFFKGKGAKNLTEEQRIARWKETQARISAEYEATHTRITELTAQRDAMLVDMIGTKYGDAAREAAVSWLDGVRNLEAEMYQGMQDFRARTVDMTSEARRQAWTEFLNSEHRPKLSKRLADNLEGSRRVYVAADDARRTRGPLQQQPAQPGEITPARVWVEEARRQKLYQMTGLDEAQQAAVMQARQIAAEYGIPSADEAGKPVSGFDKRLLATVKKYGGEDYANVYDIPEDVLRRALENRLIEKGELIGPPAPVAAIPEPSAAEVNALALELEDARINQAMQGWTDSLPGKQRITPETPVPIDPDPVGIAPPGTVDSLQPQPNYYQMFEEGWATEAAPTLRAIEERLFSPRQQVAPNLTPEQTKQLTAWLERVKGQRAQTKLAAMKFGEVSVDMAMLNYSRRYGFDNVANLIAPYQFWFGRTAINWALTAIDRPAWFANYYRLREMQEKLARPIEGFPSRLAGKMQIALPFMPEEWGKTVYADPWHNVFGFEGMAAQVMRPLLRDFSGKRSRAEYILQEMAADGTITEQQAAEAMRTKTGTLWDQAYAQAAGEYESEIASPLDLAATMFAPSVPVKWALEAAGLMQGSRTQGNALSQISTMPSMAFIQNMTSFIKPGGYNLGETLQQAIGAAENPDAPSSRGFLWDYYVARELANMAASGADPEAVKLAMVDKAGPLYTQAVDRVGKQQAVRSFASFLWLDLFPEGEQEQRALKAEFEKAADAGQIATFLDAHPEYEARMQMSNWDDPEGMLRSFLRGSVWEAYFAKTDLERREIRDQMGDLFNDAFLNKETRDYESITTETLAQWAQQLNGVVPETAPATPQTAGLELPTPELSAVYEQYQQLYDTPGAQLTTMMYALPEGMRDQFRAQHPEIGQYSEQKAIFLDEHPELLPYVIGEKNELYGAPLEVQREVYAFRAEKARRFSGIGAVQDTYYSLGKAERKAYLKQHPELRDYWDWNREASKNLSADAYRYAKGEEAMTKLIQGDDYEPEYEPDVSGFSYPLTLQVAGAAMAGGKLGSGTEAMLKLEYKRQAPPVSYEEWLALVMVQFTTY